MSFVHALRHRLRVLLNPRAHERELAEEMEFHMGLEAMQQEHAAHGALSHDDARVVARRQFGNMTYYREETRRVTGIAWLDGVGQDVRFALRTFRRAPTFTAVAVVMLALGLGANTAIFSVVDAVLIDPLPFPDAERLLSYNHQAPGLGVNVPFVPQSEGSYLLSPKPSIYVLPLSENAYAPKPHSIC